MHVNTTIIGSKICYVYWFVWLFVDDVSGSFSHWAHYTANITYSYTIELRPRDLKTWLLGFLLPKNEIIPAAEEAYEAVKVIAHATVFNDTNAWKSI